MRSSDLQKNHTFRKEVILALLLVILTLASGFLIQVLLQIQANRRAEQRAGLLMTDTLEEFSAYAWNEHARSAAAAERLADLLGLKKLYVKDDGINPTASLKDRASAMAVVKAEEAGVDVIACSSTGNAASSLAGNAACMDGQVALRVNAPCRFFM